MAKKTKKRKKDTLKQDENVFTMVKNGIKSPQFPIVAGVFLFLFAIFCIISLISFFYVNITDYDTVKNVSAYNLLSGKQDINNWGGNLGAFISYYLTAHTFGFGAFGFVIILILFALRLCKIEIRLFSKWIVATLVIMLWISCIMGFVVVACKVESVENFAGIVGIGINQGLCALTGNIGCAIVLLAFTITIPMLLFGVKYLWVKQIVLNITQNTENTKEPSKQSSKKINNPKNIEDDTTYSSETIADSEKDNNEDKRISNAEKEQVKELLRRSQLSISDREENSPSPITKPIKLNPNKEDSVSDTGEMPLIESDINSTQKDEVIPFIVKQQTEQNERDVSEEVSTEETEPAHYTIGTLFDPHEELSHYRFPTTDLLVDYDGKNTVTSERELVANKNRIVETLLNYKIEISSIEATVGPTVTLYEIVPAPGIRISKIKSLEDDIALSLSALGIRIIAPIPGKGTIGIEVPNSNPQIVSMKSMLESPQFTDNKFELPIVLGRRIDNTPYACDLAKMPHLLMAGATGQGKSVGLNAIISSLLYKKHPCDLKFIFVDPKKVELSLYSKLEKHYLAKVPNGKDAVITDTKDVVYNLRSLCQLMDTRYELLKEAGCKKITEYNKKFTSRRLNPERGHAYMPYIVVVIDEFADLIMTAGKEIEKPICRLAQLARAVGIHLIIATQRPSVNIITGTIKANFPARAAFKVSSLTDSRTILDAKGAEQLIGRGDMLVSNGGPLVRLQCALIDTEEIEKVADFIAEQQGFRECFLLPEVKEDTDDDSGEKKSLDDGKLDSKFEEAARLIVMTQQGSTSMIQRKLALGYNRAGRVMDQLESAGIVGPFRGSKARDVLITDENELNEILSRIMKKE